MRLRRLTGNPLGDSPLRFVLVNFDEDLAAKMLLLGFATSHDTLRSRDQDGTAAAFDDGDFFDASVNATARFRDLGDLGDAGGHALGVNGNVEDAAWLTVLDFAAFDVAGVFETFGDRKLELAGRDANLGLANHDSVTNTSDKVGDLIS